MSATQLATGLLFEAKPRWSGTIGAGGVAAAGTTTIPLSSAANLDNGDAYVFVINRVTTSGAKNELSEMETVIGELSGTNFVNCVRGQEGTAQAWEAGIVVEILFTATHWNKMIDAFTAEHSPDDGTHKDVTATSVTSETIEATTSADLKTLAIDGGTAMTAVKDEDDMASNSATALATQQSIKAYADSIRDPRTTTEASSATPTINTDNTDIHTITALAAAITSMTTNLSGTPVNGQKLIVRIKDDGTARAIAWGASFASRGATLPVTTVVNKTMYVGLIYNSTASVWDCVAVSTEA